MGAWSGNNATCALGMSQTKYILGFCSHNVATQTMHVIITCHIINLQLVTVLE